MQSPGVGEDAAHYTNGVEFLQDRQGGVVGLRVGLKRQGKCAGP